MDKIKKIMEMIKEFFKPENLTVFLKKYWPYCAGGLAALVLVIVVLVVALSGNDNVEPTQPTTTVPPVTTTVPETTVEPTTTVPPTTTAPLLYNEPLTGVAIAQPNTNRPVAVMLNNIKGAMPQHGVSQAEIVYEVLAEGGITRCMGIFQNISNVGDLGSIRSARKYYIDVALGYGAAYVHAGGSDEAVAYLSQLKGMDLNGQLGENKEFYYDQDRVAAGYPASYSYFTSGKKVVKFAERMNVSIVLDSEPSYGLVFDDEKILVGEAANKVTVYFNQGGTPGQWTKSTTLTYDAESKRYFAEQHGEEYVDGNTEAQISFRNVLVLRADTRLQDGDAGQAGLLTIETTGTGTGYFVCNGQVVNINWSRETVNAPFVYTLENGEVVTFGVGSTYCAIVPTNATVTCE